MNILKLFISFIFFISVSSLAVERSSAFIIKAYGDHFKVLAPSQFVGIKSITKPRQVAVIIENKTLSKLYGKIESSSGDQKVFVNTKPGKIPSTVEIKFHSDQRYFYYPLSPSSQEVELKIGQKAYEIPAKR